MSKRSIIITCIVLTVIIIGTLIFYIERIHEPKLTEENIVNNTINKVEIVNEGTISTNVEEEVVLPNTTLIMEQTFSKCGHTEKEQYKVPIAIVNMTKEEVENYYTDWNVTSFSKKEIIISKEVDGVCSEHYIVKENNGHISIYNIDENNAEHFVKNTEILTKYLPEEDQESLKNGIKIIGKKDLSIFLEDFE